MHRYLLKLMPNKGFVPITIIVALAVLILATGGVVVWQNKVSLTPQPIPTPYSTLSPVTTPILTTQPTTPPKTLSCQTDADCPRLACIQGCPAEGPCPPCGQYKCINGVCQRVYPDYSESLNKKIQLTPGQTVKLAGTNLSLTLLGITASSPDCFDCPTTAEIEVKSGVHSERVYFTAGVLATKDIEAKQRVKEAFGFQIRLESVQPELIVLRVQKL